MKLCKRCNLYVKDQSDLCPLCGELLLDDTPDASVEMQSFSMYPPIEFNLGAFHIIRRIFMFLSFLTGIVLFVINYATYDVAPVLWSLISAAAIIYAMLTVYYSILRNSNLASKILVQTIGASVLCIIIDNVIGYKGWSINFVIPALILVSNLVVIVLMIVNPMKRQTYFMYQLTITIFSILSFALCFTPIITKKGFAIVAGITCILSLIGSILFGDKGLKNELIRRFHM
ncbi:MAG: DUF6320 domain-containing protein [Velocimicrobium sp.]